MMNFRKFEQIGKFDAKTLRLKRMGEIFKKVETGEEIPNEDGQYVLDFLDSNCKEFQMYFCQYTPAIMVHLLKTTQMKTYARDEFVYQKNGLADKFYYILEGRIDIMKESLTGEAKIWKTWDEGQIFGKKDTVDLRIDDAKTTRVAKILVLDKADYQNIINNREVSSAEEKVKFIMRYIPRMRNAGRQVIEDLETLFVKEVYTKGHKILKVGEYDSFIYFVYSGEVLMSIPLTQESNKYWSKEILSSTSKLANGSTHLIITKLKRGGIFGEETGIEDQANSFLYEADSKEVIVYKIAKSTLLQYFGGASSEIIFHLRGSAQVKKNWLRTKGSEIYKSERIGLEFRDNERYVGLNPRRYTPQEIPFKISGETNKEHPGPDRAEMQKSVQMLTQAKVAGVSNPQMVKQGAPATSTPQVLPGAGGVRQLGANQSNKARFFNDMAKREETTSGGKYDKVMGWGTPRLVASNRLKKGMNTVQLQALTKLRSEAIERKGTEQNPLPGKVKGGFQMRSLANFTKNVMGADKEIETHLLKKERVTAKMAGESRHEKMRKLSSQDLLEKLESPEVIAADKNGNGTAKDKFFAADRKSPTDKQL